MNNMEQFEVFCRYILWKGVVDGKINLKGNIVDKNKFAGPPAPHMAGGCFVEKRKACSVKREAGEIRIGKRWTRMKFNSLSSGGEG